MIVVCSLARLSDVVREHRARHVVSLLKDGDKVFRPEGVGPRDHLWLSMDDIANDIEGMVPPGEQHVARLIEFLPRWDRKSPLVVHCFAGISRSSAAAFIAACHAEPKKDEAELARIEEMERAMALDFLAALPRLFLWIALAAWAVTFLGMLHALARGLRPSFRRRPQPRCPG